MEARNVPLLQAANSKLKPNRNKHLPNNKWALHKTTVYSTAWLHPISNMAVQACMAQHRCQVMVNTIPANTVNPHRCLAIPTCTIRTHKAVLVVVNRSVIRSQQRDLRTFIG